MEERPGVTAVTHQLADALGVRPQIEGELARLDDGEVQDVVEVGWQTREVALGEVDAVGTGAEGLDPLAIIGTAEAGNAPDLVALG